MSVCVPASNIDTNTTAGLCSPHSPSKDPDKPIKRDEEEISLDQSRNTTAGLCDDHPIRGNPAGAVKACHCDKPSGIPPPIITQAMADTDGFAVALGRACNQFTGYEYGFEPYAKEVVAEVTHVNNKDDEYTGPPFSIEYNRELQRNDYYDNCKDPRKISQEDCVAAFKNSTLYW